MNIALDVFSVVVIIACVVAGYKNGLIKTLFGLLKTVLAMGLAFIFSKPVGELFYDLFMKDAFEKFTTNQLQKLGLGSLNSIDSLLKSITDPVSKYIESLGSNASDVQNAFNSASGGNAANAALEAIYSPMAHTASRVVAFIAIFVVLLIFFSLLAAALNFLTKGGVLGGLNKFLGLLIGLVEAAVILYLACMGIKLLLPISAQWKTFAITEETIDNTVVFKQAYYLINAAAEEKQ